MRKLTLLLCLILLGDRGIAQRPTASPLPAPTGPHPVGRVSHHWVDTGRPEIITQAQDDYRELMVHLWYPAAGVERSPGPYMPEADRLTGVAVSRLANVFGPSWADIAAQQLRSHAMDNAGVLRTQRLPVLVFAPGGGVSPFAYTTQLEELASYGYMVAAVEFTYDSPAVVFPDGRVVTPATDFWAQLSKETPDGEALDRRITDMRAADIVFVIDKLHDLSRRDGSNFSSRLDTERIGVFGHSIGGRIAARTCQLDRRVSACLNEDGNSFWHPFRLDERGQSIRQAFMMLDHLDPELPDEVFAQMGTTRQSYVENRSARQAEAREKLYETVAGGSFHVTLTTPGVSHNSFLDIRLLGRPDSATMNVWPRDVQSATPHARILRQVTHFVRAFFDRYVREMPSASLKNTDSRADDVIIRAYGAAK